MSSTEFQDTVKWQKEKKTCSFLMIADFFFQFSNINILESKTLSTWLMTDLRILVPNIEKEYLKIILSFKTLYNKIKIINIE